jgi:hypothetical protein
MRIAATSGHANRRHHGDGLRKQIGRTRPLRERDEPALQDEACRERARVESLSQPGFPPPAPSPPQVHAADEEHRHRYAIEKRREPRLGPDRDEVRIVATGNGAEELELESRREETNVPVDVLEQSRDWRAAPRRSSASGFRNAAPSTSA